MSAIRRTMFAAALTAGVSFAVVASAPAHASGDPTFARAQALGVGGAVSVTHSYMHAQASGNPGDPTGICVSGFSQCWRQNTGFNGSTPTYLWQRDIRGDINQQYAVSYYGQANQPGVPSGAPGICASLGNVGVFSFIDNNGHGYLISAGYFSAGVYYVGEGNNNYAYWGWLPDGVLVNCKDTNDQGVNYGLQGTVVYSQLYTSGSSQATPWVQVHV